MMSAGSDQSVTRRRFAGLLGLAGVVAAGAAIAPNGARVPLVANAEDSDSSDDSNEMEHETATATSTKAAKVEMTADEMDAMHEAGIKAFPAATSGLGGQPLDFTLEDGVKVFRLSCDLVSWEFAPGQFADAFAYNGVVPGPEIKVTEGDDVRFIVTNNLLQSTAVHFHGVFVPNNMDGVPYITQPPIKPGETFIYEFPIRDGNAGAHMYHSHHNSTEQVTKGLLGSFVVEPKDPSTRPQFDVEYTMVLNDGAIGGYSLNGKSFPATQPIVVKLGQRLLIRFLNEGMMIHPMHLHGMPMTVIAEDGYLLDRPYKRDTILIGPGCRYEAIVEATELGVWAFHCHVLSHAEGPKGMFGMVTALIVQE